MLQPYSVHTPTMLEVCSKPVPDGALFCRNNRKNYMIRGCPLHQGKRDALATVKMAVINKMQLIAMLANALLPNGTATAN